MKTAIYIEDGRTQFVLTPETEIDKKVLEELQSTNLKTYRGEFYGCRGGWTRWSNAFGISYGEHDPNSDRSLIFVIDKSALPPDTQCSAWNSSRATPCSLPRNHTGLHHAPPSLMNPLGLDFGD